MILDTKGAAAKLRLSPGTLAKWRVQGVGPKWYRAQTAVRYKEADLDEWLAAGERHSTSDTGPTAIATTAQGVAQ